MSDLIKSVSDADFSSEVLQRPGVVLVDFWAEWCAPCKAMLPMLEEIAETYAGGVTVMKLNVTENEQTMNQFGARSIPLFVVFEDGKEKARAVGSMSKTRLCSFIDAQI